MEKKRKINELNVEPNIEIRESGKIKQINENKFRVSINIQKKNVRKFFPSESKAIEFKTKQNEIYNLKKKHYIPQLFIKKEILEFIAGFADGDSEITIDKRGVVRFQFYQSKKIGQPPELLYIQSFLGGNISNSNKTKKSQEWRDAYILSINTEYLEFVISLLIPFSIIKKPQLIVAKEYLNLKEKTREIKTKYYEKMKKLKDEYHKINVNKSELNDNIIAGLFVAEGSFRVNVTTPTFKITQYGCPNLLYALKNYFGFGTILKYKGKDKDYYASNQNALSILERIRPFIIGQKLEQIDQGFSFVCFKKTEAYKKNPKKAKFEIKQKLYQLKRT